MTQLRTDISDELWAAIRPARARGRWWISVTVVAVIVAALAGWVLGAFHPRAELAWNQSTIDGKVMVIHATIVNGGQLPVRISDLHIDQPGFSLVGWRLGDSDATAVPPGQQIGHLSLGGNELRQLMLYVDVDCAKVVARTRIEAAVQGPLVHRTQTMSLNDAAVLRYYCPGHTISDF
jgi:hypothetical protein